MTFRYCYDIHGLLTVGSAARLPELAPFLVPALPGRPAVAVRVGGDRLGNGRASEGPHRAFVCYDEVLGRLGFAVEIALGEQVEVWAAPLLRFSPHVLYTNVVEPILRWRLVLRGWALVHGACLAVGGRAFLITARTDTGKTTTMLRVLAAREDAAFLSDDLTLVCADGRALSYPKPMTVSRHTVAAVNPRALTRGERLRLGYQSRIHSRTGRKTALALARTRLPMATVNAIAQLLVPPPKYSVSRLVPTAELAAEARLAGLFVIERGGEGAIALEPARAMEILLRNCEDSYGFPPYAAIEGALRRGDGVDLALREAEIIAAAFSGCPAVLLRSDRLDWAWRISELIDRDVAVPGTSAAAGSPAVDPG